MARSLGLGGEEGPGDGGALKLALLQFSPRPGDVRANLATLVRLAGRGADEGARLLVAPELCTTGYYMGPVFERLAEPLDGPTVGVVRELARRRGVHVALGMAERAATGALHDSVVLVGPGGAIGAGRKSRLWDREVGVFAPGAGAVLATDVGAVGLLVCYDLEHPDLVQALVDAGAQLIVAVAAFSDLRLWRATLAARAREAAVPIVAANRTGHEAAAVFCGHSMAVAADGSVVAEAGDRGGVTVASVRVAPAPTALRRQRRPLDPRLLLPEYG